MVVPRDGDSSETLLMAADSRMYQNKTRSRAYRAGRAAFQALGDASLNPQ